MRWFGSPLQRALRRGLESDGSLYECLRAVGSQRIRSRGDAKAIVEALVTFPNQSTALASLVEQVHQSSPAQAELVQTGVRQLIRVFDEQRMEGQATARYMMDLLRVLAMYGGSEGAQRIVRAARTPSLVAAVEGSYWYPVLRSLPEGPDRDFVFASLADPLPAEPVREALLTAANALALAGGLRNHPFDSVDGCDQLRRWLATPDSDDPVNATFALAFIESPPRNDLLVAASEHADPEVRLEAAWAAARTGQPGGLDALVEFCRQPQHAEVAIRYLEQLRRDELIPANAKDPGFRAMAELASWLAHELGRPPDRLEIADHRLLDWPPVGDRIPLWMVRYEVDGHSTPDAPQSDCGLVGSTTWCFFDRLLDLRPPEDCYAVHCCWELGLYPDEADDSPGNARLLAQYRHGPLENAVVTHTLRIPRSVKYPRRIVALASADIDGESGWAVLDGPDSGWHRKSDLANGRHEEKTLLMIHVGRRLLGFDRLGTGTR